jgi:8-amino-7-oxononanoate synthase
VIDLTSALYLGLRHPSAALAPWAALTLGRPAALGGAGAGAEVAAARVLAAWLGTERAALATSTVHAMMDLEALTPSRASAIVLDRSAYPIARWGVERAAGRGRRVSTLSQLRDLEPGTLVVVDGVCPACGGLVALRALATAVRARRGVVVVDDTQAVGVLGPGGGGSLRLHGLERDPAVVIVASLAKGLGVPVCVVAGSSERIGRWLACSETRTHTSPPSAATLSALEHALAIERRHGERLRARACGRRSRASAPAWPRPAPRRRADGCRSRRWRRSRSARRWCCTSGSAAPACSGWCSGRATAPAAGCASC